MKIIKRIKWENIITILNMILFSFCIIEHIKLNGATEMRALEIPFYLLFTIVIWYVIKEIRLENK